MSFLNNLVEQFTHHGQNNQQQGGYAQESYQQSSYGGGQGPPQPPAPWYAEWDNYQNRWVFINRETGQRSNEFPSGGGYGQENRGYGGYQQQSYGGQPPPQEQKSHNGRNIALGAVAGLAGGALLMHEGEKIGESHSNIYSNK